jgi:hypothetical protein
MLTINEVKNTTEIKEMFKNRVTPIIKHFLATDELFESLDENQTIEELSDFFMKKYSIAQFEEIAEGNLTAKIRRMLGGEVLSHLFDDLTPEEIAIYEQTVKDLRGK